MTESLYTIPVNEAFAAGSECPLCALRIRYEDQIIGNLMQSAYMEPDCRIHTNRLDFCAHHNQLLFSRQNRLGMALMTQTHLQELISRLNQIPFTENGLCRTFPLFRRKGKAGKNPADCVRKLISGCALCDRVNETMARYLQTILHLWDSSEEFQALFTSSKGFCLPHFADLLEAAGKRFSGEKAFRFSHELSELEKKSLRRIESELDWFTQKFDYRNQDKSWGSSRDAVERAANKLRGASCGMDQKPGDS